MILNATIGSIEAFTETSANLLDAGIEKSAKKVIKLQNKLTYIRNQIEKGRRYSKMLRDFIK